MDIVYLLGSGSKWQNNEIRFSLRSVQKHIKGYRKIFVIGECPEWITGVEHLSFEEKFKIPDKNIADKLAFAANHKKISANFLYMNDDIFFVKDFDIKDIPTTHKGELKLTRQDRYGKMLQDTHRVLSNKGLSVNCFDNHFPMLMNKTKLKRAFAAFDWENSEHGLATKTMYGAFNEIEGENAGDNKLMGATDEAGINKYLGNKWAFSISDQAINASLINWLLKKFPERSEFETVFVDLNPKPMPAGYVKIKTTSKNRHFPAGSVLERHKSQADILVKKGFATYY